MSTNDDFWNPIAPTPYYLIDRWSRKKSLIGKRKNERKKEKANTNTKSGKAERKSRKRPKKLNKDQRVEWT